MRAGRAVGIAAADGPVVAPGAGIHPPGGGKGGDVAGPQGFRHRTEQVVDPLLELAELFQAGDGGSRETVPLGSEAGGDEEPRRVRLHRPDDVRVIDQQAVHPHGADPLPFRCFLIRAPLHLDDRELGRQIEDPGGLNGAVRLQGGGGLSPIGGRRSGRWKGYR